ncbi:Uncharacterised protein at_DN0225, partial [Pycnogonum litorale]
MVIGILLVFLVYVNTTERVQNGFSPYHACVPNLGYNLKHISEEKCLNLESSKLNFPQLQETLKKFQNLESLILKNNKLKSLYHVRHNPHRLMNSKTLKYLDVSRNQVGALIMCPFKFLYGLEILDLSFNAIYIIRQNAFVNLMKLKELNLSHNKLTSVLSEYFGKLPKMMKLDLSNNFISELEDYSFNNMKNLTFLLLRGNKLKKYNSICTGSRESNSNRLKYIDLRNNEFNRFPVGIHFGMGESSVLDLQDNNIIITTRLTMLDLFNNAVRKNITINLTG